jgi:hypothetical protein
MFRLGLRRAVLLGLAAALVFVPAASAQTVVTLTGETLTTTPPQLVGTVECATTPTGTSSMTYDVTGVASGPYPGTFHEEGSVTFTQTAILSFEAHFTIDSANGTVVGDKTRDPAELSPVTRCDRDAVSELGQTVFSGQYTATVTGSATGDFTESGRTTISISVQELTPGGTTLVMSEQFQSGGPPGTTITLTPVTATNPVGTSHTVTAVVRDASGQPVQGMTVLFTVTPGGTSVCRATDANGVCTHTYPGPETPQADEITACADTNVSGTNDPGEPCAVAFKAWSPASATPGGAHGGGFIRADEVVFGFSGQAISPTDPPTGGCSLIDRIQGIHIRCFDVATLVIAGTHATLTGTAEQDGIATNYTIDVDDLTALGQPDVFKIVTEQGYEVIGTLTGGQIIVQP